MKVLLTLLILFLTFSCMPTSCPDVESIKALYSQKVSPKNYSALMNVRYGPLRIPLFIEKRGERYTIRTLNSEILSYKGKNFCIDSVCIDLPITPDGLIFGTVLEGDEKVGCGKEGTWFEKDDILYTRKYLFFNGLLKSVEILDKNKNRTLIINYGERAKEGYYKSLNLSLEDLDLKISVDEVKIFN